MKKNLLAICIIAFFIIIACSKNSDNTQVSTPSIQDNLQLDLKKATDATNAMTNLHKNPANGHNLCYAQEHIYHNCDSLFSWHYYQYNQNLYASYNSGYVNYHMNWNGGYGYGMCGIDSIEYQSNMYTTHNYHHTDSLMYRKMMNYNLMQYVPAKLNTCYDNMQALRTNHAALHNLHY